MNIGDVWAALRIDGSKAKGDATKAGGEAGAAASKSLGASLKKGVALVGGAVAGALTVALVGRFAALERATADFRAETGATAEEAEKAGKAINDMAGRNLQPIEEIGRTLTKVTTDLGLTGDEAAKTAEQFLKFGRATGQDAAEAVLAFDDILDAWGLTAADAGGIMDQLVASHQQYGGSIADNQAALGKLAPALKAMNVSQDEAIGLLNLFAASGMDASKAQLAMNAAITKLPPGTSLMEFLETLQGIEDPAVRAREAIKVFGSRAGAGLANAMGPGIGSLDDFIITAEEVPGATNKAADASMTMVDRIKQGLSGLVSGAVDTLGPAGPLLTAVGSLGALFAPALTKAWKSVASSGAVKIAAGAAGAAASTAYNAAAGAVTALTNALTAMWTSSAVGQAIGPVATKAGGLAGAAFGAAFQAAAIVGIAVIGTTIIRELGINARKMIDDVFGTEFHLQDMAGPVRAEMEAMAAAFGIGFDEVAAVLQAEQDRTGQNFVEAWTTIRILSTAAGKLTGSATVEAVAEGMTLAIPKVTGLVGTIGGQVGENLAEGVSGGIEIGADGIVRTWGGVVRDSAGAIIKGGPEVREAWHVVVKGSFAVWKSGMLKMVDSMRVAVVDMKERIQTGKAGIIEQFRDLAWQSKHPFAEVRYAKWLGDRFDDAMAKSKAAAKRGRPAIAAQYRALADEIKAEMNSLPGVATRNAAATLAALSPIMSGVFKGMAHIRDMFGAPHRAMGGPAFGPTWVGEAGPELVWLPPSYVSNHEDSMAMAGAASGGGRSEQHIYVHDPDGGLARAGIGTAELAGLIEASRDAGNRYSTPRRG